MIQRLRLLSVTLFALYCSTAYGVGLGEIELKSALNQRFDAEIVLSKMGELEEGDIIPNLASQKDFQRVGIERSYHLTDLRFTVRQREDGEFIIHITSTRPIIEPFLNFIVQAVWPTGRILREYTVLLDPPVYGADGVEMIKQGADGAISGGPKEPPGRKGRMTIPPHQGSDSTPGRITGMTESGDTLWSIASLVRPNNSVTVQQTMLAILRENPDAFINDNINLLKAGHVLRMPDLRAISSQSRENALAEVQIQNEEFQSYKAEEYTQLDARRTAGRSSTARRVEEDGELKLLASDQGATSAGSDGTRTQELQSALTVAREDLDRARRANNEMSSRVRDLEEQIETLDGLVKLKEDQMATLRAELQKARAAPQSATPPATTQRQQQSSMLTSPMVLGGGGLLLVLIVAAVLIMLRRRRQSPDLEEEEFSGLMMEDDSPMTMDDDEGLDLDDDDVEDDDDVSQQTSDIIGEAEIYIAYGRFPQAISFLQQAIEAEPTRSDVQLKLLEVYVQTEDAAAFNEQYEQLQALGDADANARAAELQRQIPGAVADAGNELAPEMGDDDDELSFDLDDMDTETADDDLTLDAEDDDGDELSLDEAMELGDADLEFDLDAVEEEVAEEEVGADLSLDEDIDLDFEEDDTGGDDELDLDLGGDDELDLGTDDDDGVIELDMGEDDDDGLDLDLGGGDEDDDILDLGEDVDLGGDDDDGAIELDLGDDDDIELDLGDLDDDLGDLNLDEDASSKLDLARAYIEMGDNDGAKSLLQEVVSEGSDAEVSEANELLEKIG